MLQCLRRICLDHLDRFGPTRALVIAGADPNALEGLDLREHVKPAFMDVECGFGPRLLADLGPRLPSILAAQDEDGAVFVFPPPDRRSHDQATVRQDGHGRIVDEVVLVRHLCDHHIVLAERLVQCRPGFVLARVIRRHRTRGRSGQAAESSCGLNKVPAGNEVR